ncbi:KUP/HAK/KT family potassium transporter [Lacticaseibacillus parakribbianus]|uniref:KUP/HAK/KT family potassium transporter n=1 Tax=Lacticaseibacillus parakribbianus TaxID=2970927 RepID=UPI0021CB48A5|nr:KUP/HAK/KT family potassium transporter [Lacticaseibacillus parakribbianus]
MSPKKKHISAIGMLVTLGIVYGDIGTSPLYVMNAVIADAGKVSALTPEYIIGAISLIFWTLMLLTTIKYVILAMRADNNGEGGIFALYALVRNHGAWLAVPALIGGAALLADGTLTPAVTVTSAVEGLKGQNFGPLQFSDSQLVVLVITSTVLLALFLIQRFGTAKLGNAFGPVMLVWFLFLGVAGVAHMSGHLEVLRALSPRYAVAILFSPANKVGLFLLGSIFLATTGAEALYSDMGHVGKYNIYLTWPFVYVMLMLNYFGQGAWLISHYKDAAYANLTTINPFYEMLPHELRPFAIILATFAAIIASQALITGSYTLVHEAISLKFLPRMHITHPSTAKSQIYIGGVNWFLCLVTMSVVWYFRTSKAMEAAYGLAITVTMLMTTFLLFEYLSGRIGRLRAGLVTGFFGVLEAMFLVASLVKFMHGGYITLVIMLLILALMVIWFFGNKSRERYQGESEYVHLNDYVSQLVTLSKDDREPLFTTNLVYMTKVKADYRLKRTTLYSILDKQPKRASVYWFVTVNETDKPYDMRYTVDMMHTRNVISVQLYLGFRTSQHVNLYIRQIVNDLLTAGVIDPQRPHYTTLEDRQVGDFKFVIIRERPQGMPTENIPAWRRYLIGGRLWLQNVTTSPADWYGLEFSSVVEETVPLFIHEPREMYFTDHKILHPRPRAK